MTKPKLFLLAPGFMANGRREYCPECAEIWGVLNYYPTIKDMVEIIYQPISHPRPGLVELLGEGEHNCPTLVFPRSHVLPDGVQAQTANGYKYLSDARSIGHYLALEYGTAYPRGFSLSSV